MQALQAAFPEPFFNHAMAVKAQSVRGIMVEACKLGLGAECASLQEARHSLRQTHSASTAALWELCSPLIIFSCA